MPDASAEKGKLSLGTKTLTGDGFGAYFIYSRSDSNTASIGVVTATGTKGMKAAYANHYLVNGTTFPDVTIFDSSVVKDGISGVLGSGFFGNDWSVDKGDFLLAPELKKSQFTHDGPDIYNQLVLTLYNIPCNSKHLDPYIPL